jgi:hypothetical protein
MAGMARVVHHNLRCHGYAPEVAKRIDKLKASHWNQIDP